jgi:ligand-binding sensor domain-containing protein
MTKYYIHKSIYSLLFVLTFLISCNGQVKTQPQTGNQSETKTTPIGQPKLINSQGTQANDNVHCSLQDKAGNLWFGTTGSGVYCYDGKLFFNYTTKDGLSNNNVWSILEDKSGNIWFGTTDGICRYDGKNIIPISIPFSIRPIVSNNYYSNQSTKNTVWSMLQDKTGKIWFGTGDGVYCYNGKVFTRFLQNDGVINKENLHLKMVNRMLEDKNGNIWFASGMPPGMEGVCRYDGKSITSAKPNGDSWIRLIVEDKKGNLWFGGRNNGNFTYNGKTFEKFTEKVGIGNPLLVDSSGNVWFGGEERLSTIENEGGIWYYDGKTFKNYNTIDGISKYAVWSMFQDRNGNIWIGTRNTGLYKYDGKTFTNFSK